MKFRRFCLITACLWSILAMGQEADFEIRNFRENLKVIRADYKDLNDNPAALIRFTVRDSQFEFDANLGIIAQERKTGEVSLFVPYETKRITVRHPRLGVIRDYQLPRLQPKVTYDADIVITGSGQAVAPEVRPQEPSIIQPAAPVPPPASSQSKPAQPVSSPEFHVFAGVGFNAISAMGPSVLIGASYGMFSLEGGFVYGMDKVENIRLSMSSSISEAYDYSCSKVWARLGVNFDMEHFRISPQVGATFNMISGKAASGASNTTDYFKDANPMSILAAVRLSYEVVERLYVHITPQYDFSIGGDQIYDVIKQGDSKIKAWGEGFGINAGIIYEF